MSEILEFMKTQTGRVFSVREVSKEVDPDRYERDKTWAAGELKGLCGKGWIQTVNGCYWIPAEHDKNASRLEKERAEKEEERIAALSAEEAPPPESTEK